jgi:hypothetical protein
MPKRQRVSSAAVEQSDSASVRIGRAPDRHALAMLSRARSRCGGPGDYIGWHLKAAFARDHICRGERRRCLPRPLRG